MSSELDAIDTSKNFRSSEWLTTREAAIYLRIIRKNGTPCTERVRNLVSQRRIPFYKPFGRLLFKKIELRELIELTRKEGD